MKPVQRVLVLGAGGQVGSALTRYLPQVLPGVQLTAATRATLDITDTDALLACIRAVKPEVIFNAAAYNFVDRAEREPQVAQAVNHLAAQVLGEAVARSKSFLVHFSSNYVFDGDSDGAYAETDEPHPLNAYGQSKYDGERAIVGTGCAALILRTSWVYGATGINFFRAMLHQAALSNTLSVVDDQFGTPNAADWLGRVVADLFDHPLKWLKDRAGLYHLSATGFTSWYGFAEAIFQHFPENAPKQLLAISSEEYAKNHPDAARRPAFAVLNPQHFADTFDLEMPNWETVLKCGGLPPHGS